MFTGRITGYSRWQLFGRFEMYRSRAEWPEGKTIFGLDWREQVKLAPERRPHPAYHYWRNAHPCYWHRKWQQGKTRIFKEAWLVKIERGSPRAIKPKPSGTMR
jgi:hypothetical protein